MPSGNRNAHARTQNPAGPSAVGSALPPPPPYNPAASSGRRGRNDVDSSASARGSDPGNSHRRRGGVERGSSSRRGHQGSIGSSRDPSNGGTDYRRGAHSGGSSASVSHAAERPSVVVTNPNGEKVEGSRHGSSRGGGAPRVVHRVGMECLSPINIARGDGPSTGGE